MNCIDRREYAKGKQGNKGFNLSMGNNYERVQRQSKGTRKISEICPARIVSGNQQLQENRGERKEYEAFIFALNTGKEIVIFFSIIPFLFVLKKLY